MFFECVSLTSFGGFPGQGEGQRFQPCAYLLVIGHIWRQLAGSGVLLLAIGGARSSPAAAGIADASFSLSARRARRAPVRAMCRARRRALRAAFQRRGLKGLHAPRRTPTAKRGRQVDGSCARSRGSARPADPGHSRQRSADRVDLVRSRSRAAAQTTGHADEDRGVDARARRTGQLRLRVLLIPASSPSVEMRYWAHGGVEGRRARGT